MAAIPDSASHFGGAKKMTMQMIKKMAIVMRNLDGTVLRRLCTGSLPGPSGADASHAEVIDEINIDIC
jgi:hypothetical protein